MSETQTKVLVIEDDVTMREIVVHKLTTNGFAVVEAADGKSAIETWKKEKPDIVLLDLMLPETDGFQILETVRKSADGDPNKASVMVLSNLFGKEDIKRAKDLNIDDFLVKAYYTTEEILSKVKEAVKKRGKK
ncbi:MAG: response regulator [Candidatus Doudnabacteria bacterium]|nr:response regulator [Candidatus Doudnabacteria bacterium]